MSDSVILRERLALGDRTFTVLAEPWYDAASDEWKGRYLYVPLDRSLAAPVASTTWRAANGRTRAAVSPIAMASTAAFAEVAAMAGDPARAQGEGGGADARPPPRMDGPRFA